MKLKDKISKIVHLSKLFVILIIALLFIVNESNTSAKEERKDVFLLNSLLEKLNSNPNEALKISFQILELPVEEVHDSIRAFAMVEIGYILEKQGFDAQALTFYLQGLDLLTEIGMRPISGYLLIDIGNIYFKMKQFNLASDKYNEAIKVFEVQKAPGGVYTAINNLALIEKEKKNYLKAEKLFTDALNITEQLPEIPYLKAHSYGYLGDLFKTIGLVDSAMTYYNLAMSLEIKERGHNLIGLNHQKTASILIERGDTVKAIARLKLAEIDFLTDYNVFNISRLFIQLADLLFLVNKNAEALEYLNRALKIAENESMIIQQINILKKFNEYYQKSGNLQQLYKNLNKINELLEKRYQADVSSLIQKVDTQSLVDEYKQRIRIKELELEKSNLFRNAAIISSVFFFVFLWLLFARYHYKKKYLEQLLERSKEVHATELEIEKLKKEQANRELLVQAANIQSQNDFLFNIKKQLKISADEEEKEKSIKKIISTIDDTVQKDSAWKQFEEQFVKIHPQFFEKLSEKFPLLTANELKLCAYHKMNLGTKEIASLTALSIRSIQTTRYRLRKKLNLPSETSFQEFINGI